MPLTAAQIERYQRHILLKDIGGSGQQALSKARILIIGIGGLGCPLAQYLAAAGIGHLGLVDDDRVSLSNLQRQILFTNNDIGKLKAEAARKALAALNPEIDIIAHTERLTEKNTSLIADYDIIADCSDNFATRFLVSDSCLHYRKPLVSAAISQFEGQLSTFKPYLEGYPSYRDFVPQDPELAEDCEQLGVVGALGGVMGSLQAIEIIKEITGAGDGLAGKILIYDGLRAHTRLVTLKPALAQ